MSANILEALDNLIAKIDAISLTMIQSQSQDCGCNVGIGSDNGEGEEGGDS